MSWFTGFTSFLATAPVARRAPTARWFLLLFLGVCVVFHPALRGEFLAWDDDVVIVHNPHLRGLTWTNIRWAFTSNELLRFRPLECLTWATLYQIFGLNPVAFHLANLLVHAANAGLVFLLIRRLLQRAVSAVPARTETDLTLPAGLAAAVWAVHPLRVETTAWAVTLGHNLALLFLLLALLSWLRAVTSDANRRFYWLAVAAFAASLLSFPTALGALVVWVVLDVYPLRRLSPNPRNWLAPSTRRIWLEKIPFLLLTLFAAWVNLRILLAHPTAQMAPASDGAGWLSSLMQAFFVWGYYLWKPLVPFSLTPLPTHLVDVHPAAPRFLASAALVIGWSIGAWALRHRWPAMLAVWVCHLGLLAPFLGLTERPHYATDRYGLLTGIGWAVLLGAGFVTLGTRAAGRRGIGVAAVVLLAGLGWLSYRQTFVWQNSLTLFEHILAHLPEDPKLNRHRSAIYLRLGRAHLEREQWTEAAAAAGSALRLVPNYPEAHWVLGEARARVGDTAAAEASLVAALRLRPDWVEEFLRRGRAWMQRGEPQHAITYFRAVLTVAPDHEAVRQDLAAALQAAGRLKETEPQIEPYPQSPAKSDGPLE